MMKTKSEYDKIDNAALETKITDDDEIICSLNVLLTEARALK